MTSCKECGKLKNEPEFFDRTRKVKVDICWECRGIDDEYRKREQKLHFASKQLKSRV
jgi:hypothetical protein